MTSLATKHELILEHIKQLEIGHKLSVRQIAKALQVSEGTAYRAIKNAENQGYVSTIERVGTIRIEKKHKGNIERLTYAEVVKIVDGQVVGGRAGLHKTLNRFVIGAMKLEAMKRYIEAGALLIVGNRDQVHGYALKSGAAVLITGGFEAKDEVRELANLVDLPIISTAYDTFTVAAMINRAIYDRLIKKEIIHVSDILIPFNETSYIHTSAKVSDWQTMNKETGHSRYPVVDEHYRVQGIVTAKDIVRYKNQISIEKVMTKAPITVTETTTVAAAAHRMIWEGIECLPVINEASQLIGIITRQDVLKAMQMAQRQPQAGETIDDIITDQLMEVGQNRFQFTVSPQMTNHLGALSYGIITTILTTVTERILSKQKKGDLVIENISLYFLKPVQLEYVIIISPRILEVTRRYGKIDIELYHEEQVVGKAFLIAQFIDRYS